MRSSEIMCLPPPVQLPTSRRRIELIEYLKNCSPAYLKPTVRVGMRITSATPDKRALGLVILEE